METNGLYTLKREDNNRLLDIAEEIHQKIETMKGQIISWEDFTVNYMGFDLPEDEVERMKWVNARPTWVQRMNSIFLSLRYPYHIQVNPHQGISFNLGKAGAFKKINKGIKRQTSAISNTIREMDEVIKSGTYGPSIQRAFKSFKDITRNNMYNLIGQVDTTREISDQQKEEIKTIIKRGLPPHDPLKLDLD